MNHGDEKINIVLLFCCLATAGGKRTHRRHSKHQPKQLRHEARLVVWVWDHPAHAGIQQENEIQTVIEEIEQ